MKYPLIVCVLLLVSCNGIRTLKNEITGLTPYEEYALALERANLHSRPLGERWIDAGARAFKDSVVVSLPYQEAGHFVAHTPEARSYRFNVLDGQVLTLNGSVKTTSDARVFADLFVFEKDKWKHVASADSSLTLQHEFNKDSNCLLRIQPELLVNAYYAVSIGLTPVLINPVHGASNKSIQSFWGDSRDGGKRKHEGIDIFAKKGTPVVAPTNGRISRIGNTNLGGKVVWMHDQQRGHSYYFAHLDSQYVSPGMIVKRGDTLGTVGNTGNARYTPSHLHFGIYQAGAKNPLNYVKTFDDHGPSPAIDTTINGVYETAVKKVRLQSAPSKKAALLAELPMNTYVYIIAQSKEWYRVRLPNELEGFIEKKHIRSQSKFNNAVVNVSSELRSSVGNDAVLTGFVVAGTTVERLASFEDYILIRTSDHAEGWIPKASI